LALRIIAFDAFPVGAARELVVDIGGSLQVYQIRFQDVMGGVGVGSRGFFRDQRLSLERRDAKIKDNIFFGKTVDVVFEMLNPVSEFGAVIRSGAGYLVGKVGTDIAVGDDDFTFFESGDDWAFTFKAVTGIEQGGEVGVLVGSKLSIEKLADHFAEPGVVLRKTGGEHPVAQAGESLSEEADLSVLAASVDAFDGDELSAGGHEGLRG